MPSVATAQQERDRHLRALRAEYLAHLASDREAARGILAMAARYEATA